MYIVDQPLKYSTYLVYPKINVHPPNLMLMWHISISQRRGGVIVVAYGCFCSGSRTT